MNILMMIAAAVFVLAAVAHGEGVPGATGPVGLVYPRPDAPLSARQVEERTRTTPGGTSSTETVASQVYRDSAGRMRIEWRFQSPSGGSIDFVFLIDPVARFAALLQPGPKIASYFLRPNSDSGPFQVSILSAVGQWPSGTKWQTNREGLGTRVIGGVEVEGARDTLTSEDQPPLIAVQEQWASPNLGLTFEVEASGPNWKHTAKLQNLDRHEPDPALFVIPSDYEIQK